MQIFEFVITSNMFARVHLRRTKFAPRTVLIQLSRDFVADSRGNVSRVDHACVVNTVFACSLDRCTYVRMSSVDLIEAFGCTAPEECLLRTEILFHPSHVLHDRCSDGMSTRTGTCRCEFRI